LNQSAKFQLANPICPILYTNSLEDSISGDLGDFTEDNREYYSGKQRLKQIPQWAKDGLLIKRNKIAFYKKHYEVSVFPYLTQMQVDLYLLGLDD
jgi:hypothetical protein